MKLNNYWRISTLVISVLIQFSCSAQYAWVYLEDKCSEGEDYFASPVCDTYVKSIEANGIIIQGTSKWLNAACIKISEAQKLEGLPFVSRVVPFQSYQTQEDRMDEDLSYGQGDWQIEMLNLHQYHVRGNTGEGVTLALFDGGFWKVDSLPIFDSLWANNQVKAAYDFVDDEPMQYDESTHGMQVLALAGINYPDNMVGAAPGADFVLARTENTYSETHLEELNWLNAMEWADSVGVDIIHSSLGYSLFDSLQGDYTYQDMDGESTIITIAAEAAAKRGIFITNSAGNSGNDPWFHITAPCDGVNVLCVGAVDSFEQITAFSSRGPSADGRIKPDVVAMGRRNTIPRENGLLRRGSGTSFSGPLVAGMVACLKGAHPNKTNAQVFEAILKSSDRYDAPNNEYGYGLPDVLVADSILETMPLLGTESVVPLELDVFPNPAHVYIQINTEPGAQLEITNLQGNLVLNKTLHNWINFVDVSDLVSSTYIVRVMYEGKVAMRKVMVGSR